MTKNLKSRFEKVCNDYAKAFCEKQDVEIEYWVADDPSGICEIADLFINFNDMRLDIDENIPVGLIFEYYSEQLDFFVESYDKNIEGASFPNFGNWLLIKSGSSNEN